MGDKKMSREKGRERKGKERGRGSGNKARKTKPTKTEGPRRQDDRMTGSPENLTVLGELVSGKWERAGIKT